MLDAILAPIMAFTDWLWGIPMLALITVAAIAYTIALKGFQFRYFPLIMKNTFGKIFDKGKGEGTITPFQAAASALASTLGTGNIAGVAVAVSLGGPGAIFWMWVIASIAIVLKYAEVTLALKYREKRAGEVEYRGGFMYMVINGLGPKFKWLATLFAVLFAIEMAIAPAVQSNAVASTVKMSFGVGELITGSICVVLCGIVVIGGIKRIAKVADKVVPLMAVMYFSGALVILAMHVTAIPGAFATIFTAALGGAPAGGGFAGATVAMAIRHGLARGIFAHEAGMATAPFAHSQATTDLPGRQGVWGIFEVFISTFVVCTATGLVLVTTGILHTGEPGAALVTQAFATVFPGHSGDVLVTIALVLFAFTTMLVNIYYGEKAFEYFVGPKYILPYQIVALSTIIMGAVGGLRMIWGLFDFFMGLTVVMNVIVIFFLRKEVVQCTKELLAKLWQEDAEKKAAKAAKRAA